MTARTFLGLSLGNIKLDHTIDMQASEEFEIIVGSDNIVRINIDGKCILRARMSNTCLFRLNTPIEMINIDGDLIIK